jgi:hypothetical protein
MKQTYYEINREKILKYAKEYQKKNIEQHKKHMRKYIKKHSEKILDYNKDYKKEKYDNDILFKGRQILKTYASQFLNGKKESFSKFVGMSSEEYKAHIINLLPEGYDWIDYKIKWRIGKKNKNFNPLDNDSICKYFNYKNSFIELINKDVQKKLSNVD